ncbi:hypothetical protein NKT77_08830 [Moraxella sp. FZLJ2107]|uniref:hypothetical protein n=1 Tax=unclassified Moraxella TaxID=2685852 RepID=UPI0020C838D2|nr:MULTISPECIES: hypothetical protein [unclassified Moraxella]UTO04605.1 hypothetical protein NKT77_08830 [Moraxella sp. FZLJ2107]UTO21333.1 hypothetical protein NKU06_05615 [Moraxella sp. FZLJ2109]
MKALIFGAAAAAVVLTGCASTGKVAPQYINPNTYQSYDCQSLQSEVSRITKLVEQTQNQQVGLSASGIGIGLTGGRHGIYPSISLGMGAGSGQRAAKQNTLSRLYGEHDAMVVSARQKGCAFAQGMKIYGE